MPSARERHPSALGSRHLGHAAPSVRQRSHARVLGVAGHAHAEEPAVPAGRVTLALEPFIVGQLQGHRERLRIVAAVVDESRRGGEGIGALRNQVAEPDLGGIEAEASGEEIEGALHDEGAHGHAHAAIGAEGRLVGGDGQRFPRVGGRAVGPGQDGRGAGRLEGRGEWMDVVGAVVRDDARAKTEEHAVVVGGRLDLHPPFPGLRGGGEVLAPRLDPLHGAAGHPRQRRHRHVLGQDVHLLPEAPAGVGHDHAHVILGKAKGAGHGRAKDVGRLGPRPDGEPVALPRGDHAAAFEGGSRAAAVAERLTEHEVRAGEGSVHVSVGMVAVKEQVAGNILVEERSIRRDGGVHAREGGQGLVVDVDELTGIGGLGRALRAQGGHGLSHEADALGGEGGPHRRPEALALEARRERGDPRRHVLPRQRGDHSGRASRALDIHAPHSCVRVGTAHERGVEESGEAQVVEIGALPREETRVLHALDAPARQTRREAQMAVRGRVRTWRREAGPRPPAARAVPCSS